MSRHWQHRQLELTVHPLAGLPTRSRRLAIAPPGAPLIFAFHPPSTSCQAQRRRIAQSLLVSEALPEGGLLDDWDGPWCLTEAAAV